MNKEFIPYELALDLKELKFDEQCFGYFENQDVSLVINFNNLPLTEEQSKRLGLYTIDNRNSVLPQWATAAPLYQQVFRWFREKRGLYGYPFSQSSQTNIWFKYFIQQEWKDQITSDSFNTHEEAELECLKKLIEIVKENHENSI